MSSREAPGWYAVLICSDLMEDVSLSHCIEMAQIGTPLETAASPIGPAWM